LSRARDYGQLEAQTVVSAYRQQEAVAPLQSEHGQLVHPGALV